MSQGQWRTFLPGFLPHLTLTQAATEHPVSLKDTGTNRFQDHLSPKFMNCWERALVRMHRSPALPSSELLCFPWKFQLFLMFFLALVPDFHFYRSSKDHSNVLDLLKYSCALRKYMIIYPCHLPSVSYMNRYWISMKAAASPFAQEVIQFSPNEIQNIKTLSNKTCSYITLFGGFKKQMRDWHIFYSLLRPWKYSLHQDK